MKLGATDALTRTQLLNPKSQATNNTFSAGLDISHYKGLLTIGVAVGQLTAGDTNSVFTVALFDSATNNAQNAAAITNKNVATDGNNTNKSGVITIDPRAQNQFLFARITLTGANSPAAPIAVEVTGQKDIV